MQYIITITKAKEKRGDFVFASKLVCECFFLRGRLFENEARQYSCAVFDAIIVQTSNTMNGVIMLPKRAIIEHTPMPVFLQRNNNDDTDSLEGSLRFRRCTHWKINALRLLPAILTVIPVVILTKNLTYSYYDPEVFGSKILAKIPVVILTKNLTYCY